MRPALAQIDLGAIRHNLKRARQVAPGSKVMAVVKANAYGHGIVRVLPALAEADAFAVACFEEAVAVREAGIRQPILLLEGCFDREELALCGQYGLWTVVHDIAQLEMLEREPPQTPVTVWLKIDTGMRRLGFAAQQIASIRQRLRACPGVAEIHWMTHLANADDRDDGQTRQQLAAWDAATEKFQGLQSLANSAGTLAWPASRRDWVRPGVMLYGISPFIDSIGVDEGLLPAMTLTTRLIAVKQAKRGDRVGYSGTFCCPEDMPLGIAAIGYGDGYPRHAPSGTPVLVDGHLAALAGRVSMDMLCIDLRKCPQADVGAKVTLWGNDLPAERIARAAGTIAYEILCRITTRVHFRAIAD